MQHVRPRVLMLGPSLANRGGIASVLQLYVSGWDSARYELRLIATFVNASKMVKLFVALWAFLRYCYHLALWKPDLIHIHFASGASFYRKVPFIIVGKLNRTPVLLHCHAADFDVFYKARGIFGKRSICFVLNSAVVLLVLSQEWLSFFESLALSTELRILTNPIVCPPIDSHHDSRKPIVLSLGRLGHRKGTYDILEAVPYVLEAVPDAEFWFGGDGDLDQVKKILSNKHWKEKVQLLGWLQGHEKEMVLNQASVFLLPSYHEGLPIAILEAMAYSLPVISTPVGGIPQAVSNEYNGFLIAPGDSSQIADKTIRLLESPELRKQMGDRGRQRVLEKFELQSVLNQLYVTYAQLNRLEDRSYIERVPRDV